MGNEVITTVEDGILRIELNRPDRLNALTAAMVQTLVGIIEHAGRADSGIRVVVVAGALPGFCAGADLSSLKFLTDPTTSDEQRLLELRATGTLILGLYEFPGPTIAEVGGAAVGGGCNLALVCDLVIASRRATFGEVFVEHGLGLDMGGSWLLPRLVGPRRAAELAFSGRIVDADEALRLGLVTEVVAEDRLRGTVADRASSVARRAPLALGALKQALHAGVSGGLADALELEAKLQCALLRRLAIERGRSQAGGASM